MNGTVLACVFLSLTAYVVERLWKQDKKLAAVLVPVSAVLVGLVVAPTWTIVLVIVGLFTFAASFVRTTRATLTTAAVMLGLFGYVANAAMNDMRIRSRLSQATFLADPARAAVDDAYEQGLNLATIPAQGDPVDSKRVAYHVTSITTADSGTVTIELNDHSHLGGAKNGIITYAPTVEDDQLKWTVRCSFRLMWCPKK